MEHALAAVGRGWHVFPVDSPELPRCAGIGRSHDPETCADRGKHPTVTWGSKATTDPQTVAAWFAGTALNYGIATEPSGLVVIDEDEPGAADLLAQACGYEHLPATFTVATARGRHFYYAAPANAPRTGAQKAPGIDVRGAGGYVVGPGSLHASGALYTVTDDSPALPMPRWLAQALEHGATSPASASEVVSSPGVWDILPAPFTLPERIDPGTRNDTLFRYACSLVGRGYRDTEALTLLRDAYGRCTEPYVDETPDELLTRALSTYGAPDPDDATEAALDAAGALAREVEKEVFRLRVREAARERIEKERAGVVDLPPLTRLDAFLAEPDDPITHRIDGLMPSGGRVVLSAPHKAGKTTTVGNFVRCLVDGRPFLGDHPVIRAHRVVVLDNELDERMLRRWLRDQGITETARVDLVPLRGRLSAFNILDAATRARWAEHIGAADVLVFDCLRPALDALGLSEDKEAGRFLEALDELTAEAGIAETLVVHHMGHSGERSRGDSRILDWPDAVWKLVKDAEDEDEATATRRVYFSAYGRDVDQPERLLAFDVATRHLSIAGGTRRDTREAPVREAVVELLADAVEPLSGRQIENALTATGHPRDQIRTALKRLRTTGVLDTVEGPRRALLHALNPSVRGSERECAGRTENECASAPIGRTLAHSLVGEAGGEEEAAHSPLVTLPGRCTHGYAPEQRELHDCGELIA